MNITALEIDGYGVWSGLKVERLADGLNVLYGPNEAGKTTLLQLRPLDALRLLARAAPLPAAAAWRSAGWLDRGGRARNGRFQIARHDDADADARQRRAHPAPPPTAPARASTCSGPLVEHRREHLQQRLCRGLREMQELGTLSDGEAAELLYSLSAGVDRVSLVDVLRELESLAKPHPRPHGGPCQVAQLLAEREKLRQEIEQLDDLMHRYGQLAAGRLQLDREVARLEEEKNTAEYESRVIELAIGLRDRWRRRDAMDDELAALGPQPPLPPDAIRRLDALNARIRTHQQQRDGLRRQRQELRGEAAGLAVNEALRRQAPRIEAMQEQLPWIAALEGQAAGLEKELAELSAAVAAEHKGLGLDERGGPIVLPSLSPRMLRHAALGGPGSACLPAEAGARQAAAAAEEAARTLAAQIEASLSSRQDRLLPAAIDRAGSLVGQLRRRVQIEQRLEQMASSAQGLDRQSRRLLERAVAAALAAGRTGHDLRGGRRAADGRAVPARLADRPPGWAVSLAGLAGELAAGLGKIMAERAGADGWTAARSRSLCFSCK